MCGSHQERPQGEVAEADLHSAPAGMAVAHKLVETQVPRHTEPAAIVHTAESDKDDRHSHPESPQGKGGPSHHHANR